MADNIKIKIDIALDPSGVGKGAAETQARLDKLADAMTAAFNKTADAERRVTDESRRLDEQKKKLGDTLGGMANKIGAYNLAWEQGYNALVAATGAVKNYIKESALLNARYETMGVVLDVVGRNAGYSRGELDLHTAALEKSGITMIASRESIVRMIQANMDLSQATGLARAAQDAAVIANINSSQAFERLVYAIQSGQPEMLRTMGINVQFEGSYAAMAKQLGVNVDQLTEQEKVQARANVVMEAATRIAGTYEAAMTTAGKQILSLDRYTENLKVQIGETWNEALVIAVRNYTDILTDANEETRELTEKKKLQEWGRDVMTTFAWVGDVVVGGFDAIATAIEQTVSLSLKGMNALRNGALSVIPGGKLAAGLLGLATGHDMDSAIASFTDIADANLKKRLARPQLRDTLEKFLAEKDRDTALRTSSDAGDDALFSNTGAPKAGARPGGKGGAGGSDWSQRDDQMYKNRVAAAKELGALDKKRIKSQEDEIRLFDRQTADWGRYNKQLDQQAQHWKDIVDPMEPYRRKIEEINNLWSQGKLTTEEYAIAVQSVEDAVDKLVKKVKEKDPFKDMKNSIEGWGRDFSKTMGEMVVTADFSFDRIGDAFKSLAADIAAAQIQKQFTDPIVKGATAWLGNLFGGNPLAGFEGHLGALAGIEGTPRMIPAAALAGAGRMHGGGMVLRPNEVPMILERGEEVLTRRDPRHRYNQGGAGGSMNIKVAIENQSGTQLKVAEVAPQFDGEQYVVRVLLKDLRDEGPIAQALARKSASTVY